MSLWLHLLWETMVLLPCLESELEYHGLLRILPGGVEKANPPQNIQVHVLFYLNTQTNKDSLVYLFLCQIDVYPTSILFQSYHTHINECS
jgi:hypothetical protein